MFYLQNAGPMVLILWGLSALGIYHILREILWRLSPRRPKWRRAAQFRRWRPASKVVKWQPASQFKTAPGPVDNVEQLRWVMAAPFSAERVLSWSEYQVFKEVEAEAVACNNGYREFAQTSLGEVLSSPDDRARRAINSKRVDILVIAYDGMPVLAVEYQGPGHHQGTAAARDAVKKEALRKAGVGYLEVFDDDPSEEIRAKVRSLLGRHVPA